MRIEEMTDGKLLGLCAFWGSRALFARNKFIALLPEVYKRKLYEKKGFNSIFEFAFRIAGLTEELVQKSIRLEVRLEPDSEVRDLFMSGTVSISKIEKVISILTKENDHEVANILINMPRKTVETYVRDLKNSQNSKNLINTTESLSSSSINLDNTLISSAEIIEYPPLSNEVKKKLNDLAKKNIDINEIILKALEERAINIAEEKEKLAKNAQNKFIEQITEEKTISRAVPTATKRLLAKEFGTKCAVDFCRNKSEEIHHTARFSVAKTHNPYYLAPLCKSHHQLAHNADVRTVEVRKFAMRSG